MINKDKILNDTNYFSSGVLQSYLLLISSEKNLFFTRTTQIYSWKSKVMPEKKYLKITSADNVFASTFSNSNPLPVVSLVDTVQ